MQRPCNATIAAALDRIAELLERDGVEPTPVAAYRRAARTIAQCARPASELIDEDGVEALHRLGIGYLIGGLITDWLRSGELPLLERLERKHSPETALRCVPGIGPRLAREVCELGITSVDALALAARNGHLDGVCGFGPRRLALIKGLKTKPRFPHQPSHGGPVQLDLIAG
jgi:DNA polymerase (family 10)